MDDFGAFAGIDDGGVDLAESLATALEQSPSRRAILSEATLDKISARIKQLSGELLMQGGTWTH